MLGIGACSLNAEDLPQTDTASPFTLIERSSIALPFEPWAYGLSALTFGDLGGRSSTLLAFSDTGRASQLELLFDDAGALSGSELIDTTVVFVGDKAKGATPDLESVDQLPDGSWLAGSERPIRLSRYVADKISDFKAAPDPVDGPNGMNTLGINSGFEALTVLDGGSILLIAEDIVDGSHPMWIGNEGDWTRFNYRADGGFDPVEAQLHPCGGVLVLERVASVLKGLAARLAYIPQERIDALNTGQTLHPILIGQIDPQDGWGNFEGMAVRAPESGTCDDPIDLFIVSDDNAQRLLPRFLLHYQLSRADSP